MPLYFFVLTFLGVLIMNALELLKDAHRKELAISETPNNLSCSTEYPV